MKSRTARLVLLLVLLAIVVGFAFIQTDDAQAVYGLVWRRNCAGNWSVQLRNVADSGQYDLLAQCRVSGVVRFSQMCYNGHVRISQSKFDESLNHLACYSPVAIPDN